MQTTYLDIISVVIDGTCQLLTVRSAFITYLRTMGVRSVSLSAICRLQEGLWFSWEWGM